MNFKIYMSKIQEVFNRIQESRQEQKKINQMYKDALSTSDSYDKISEELKILKAKKKEIETEIKSDFKEEFDKIDILKADIKNDNQLLNDIVLTKISKGENIEITDQYNSQYEPVFNVKFKKM